MAIIMNNQNKTKVHGVIYTTMKGRSFSCVKKHMHMDVLLQLDSWKHPDCSNITYDYFYSSNVRGFRIILANHKSDKP